MKTPAEFARKNRSLDEHCAAFGRDPAGIQRSVCLFADIEDNEKVAVGKRAFMGKHLF